jgi:hypothetical protein
MRTSKIVINSILAGFCIVAFSASASLAESMSPPSSTGGAHGAGVLITKTQTQTQERAANYNP